MRYCSRRLQPAQAEACGYSLQSFLPNALSETELRLGDAVMYAGQRERALELYTDALKWAEQVMWSEPESPLYRGSVCQSHYCIATALSQNEKEKALAHWRAALKLLEELYKKRNRKRSHATRTR